MQTFIPTTLALLLATVPALAQDKHTLRSKLQPGAVTWSLQTQEMTQDMAVGGRSMQTSMQTSMWLESKVTAVTAGVASIEQRFARIKATGNGPGMKVDYDSDVEGSKPGPLRDLAKLAGKVAKMRVDERGKMSEMSLPDDLGAATDETLASLKQGFEQAFTAWPEQPIAIGETWESAMEFPMAGMGSMKAKIVNKLLDVKDQLVTIEQTLTMDTSGVKLPAGMTMEVGKAGGKSTFDLRLPMPIESTMDMEMKMGNADNPQLMTMQMRTGMKKVEAPPAKPAAEAPKPDAPKTGGGK